MKCDERKRQLCLRGEPRAALARLFGTLICLFALVGGGCGDHDNNRYLADAQVDDGDAAADDGSAGDAELDSDASADAGTVEDSDGGDLGVDAAGEDAAGPGLASISIEPAEATLAVGTAQQLTAIGIYEDNTTADITGVVTWSSSDPSTADFGSTPGAIMAVKDGHVTVSAQLGSIAGMTGLTVSGASLVSLEVTPFSGTIANGTSVQFAATGTFSDATTQDLTDLVTWSSSSTDVASIDAMGLARGLTPGMTTISASFGGKMTSTSLTVSSATLSGIDVNPASVSLAKGSKTQLAAIGTFSDNTTQDLTLQVVWASSDATLAAVDGASGTPGLVTALGEGSASISATLGSVSGMASVEITPATLDSIDITPLSASFAKGTTQQYLATGTYSDGTTQDLTASVAWTSSDPSVVSVSNQVGSQGHATAVATGSATLTAALGDRSGMAQATVTPASLVSLTLSPVLSVIANGTTQQFTATGAYSDGSSQDLTAQVAWSSSDATVAGVSNAAGSEGLASGLMGGDTTITAQSGSVSASTTLTVTNATLTAITVTPVNPTIAKGTTQAFVATGVYSDQTTQDLTTSVTWSSSNPSVATIGNTGTLDGVATGLAPGQTTITATQGAISDATILTVTPATLTAIAVTPADATIPKLSSLAFTATGTFSDGSTQDVTALVSWSSSMTSVATISNAFGSRGVAVAAAAGDTTITAARSGVMGTATLHVSDVTLESITLSPLTPTIARALRLQFKAVGTYSDMSTQDVTSAVTWSSSASNVAVIGNNLATKGEAVGLTAGDTTITATVNGVMASTTLTVSTATLESIAVTPAAASLASGETQQYTAIGTYSDMSTQDLTTQVLWLSSNRRVATVSNLQGSRGEVTAVMSGDATLTAFALGAGGGVTGTTTVTVP